MNRATLAGIGLAVVFVVLLSGLALSAAGSTGSSASGPTVLKPTGFATFKGKLPKAAPTDPNKVFPLGPPEFNRGKLRTLTPSGRPPRLEQRARRLPSGRAQVFSAPNRSFAGQVGGFPPDPNGDVGPNDYVQAVNSNFQVFDKDGNTRTNGGPFTIQSLFAALPNAADRCRTNNDGDPIVLYDPIANRWLISQFALTRDMNGNPIGPTFQCIAVSQTGDPRPTAGYNIYSYNVLNGGFADYPHLAVWPDAYYMSTNQFSGATGGGAYAFDRTNMLAGNAAPTVLYFNNVSPRGTLPSDLDGTTQPPAGAPNFFVNLNGNNQLQIHSFHADFANTANATYTLTDTVNVGTFDTDMCGGFLQGEQCIPQPGFSPCPAPPAGGCLAALSDRMMHRVQYRNYGTFQSLLMNHTVDVGTDRAGIRWNELRRTATAWSSFQEGTHSPGTGQHNWMASIAQNGQRDMGLGYTSSSGTLSPSVHYTGRLAGDAAGTMSQGDNVLQAGNGSQSACQAVDTTTPPDGTTDFCRGRWGDYSNTSVDPVDDCTFWYTGEYVPTSSGVRGTRIGAFRFPGCEKTLSINDVTVTEGNTGTTNANFTVRLSGASGLPVRVDFATQNGSAQAPGDFQAQTGTLTFQPGETTKTISVPVNGDNVDELDENFHVRLSNPRDASITDDDGLGTIIDDDTAMASINDVTVDEGNTGTTPAQFTVSLSNPADREVRIDFKTTNGSATAPSDYQATQGTLVYAPGEQTKPVTVLVNGDTVDELDEQFFVDLSNPVVAVIADARGVGTIVDDDRNGVFSCRATGLRLGSTEYAVANPSDTPCRDRSASVIPLQLGGITANAIYATTDQTPDDATVVKPAVGDKATAHAAAADVVLRSGFNTVTAKALSADAQAICNAAGKGAGPPQLSSDSRVVNVVANGKLVATVTGRLDVPLILATLRVNQTISGPNQVTRRALVLDNLFAPDIVVSEAKADFGGTAANPNGNPCAL